GDDLLELAVLFLELTQSLHLGWCQTGVLLAPTVVGRLANPGLAANLADRCALLSLTQDESDLWLGELRSLHGPSSSSGPNHTSAKLEFSSNDRSRNREEGHPDAE